MAGGLAAGYGALGLIAAKYLYVSGNESEAWQYVAPVNELVEGTSLEYVSPVGTKLVIARQSAGDTAAAFVALSSTCPHLGCQVHWEPQNDRFFCPCHNGVFDPQGHAIEGPPAEAKPAQQLAHFPLKVEDGLLFIKVPLTSIGGVA